MLIDSVVVRIIKFGAGVAPAYSITLFGDGKLVYEGDENVEVKGKINAPVKRDAILSVLSEFKDSGFFYMENRYPIDKSLNRPYTVISISMPNQDGQTLNKTVSFYQDDGERPTEFIELENNIDQILRTKEWTGENKLGITKIP